jgi:hypothetical protein
MYVCAVCGRGFNRSDNLNRHATIHTDTNNMIRSKPGRYQPMDPNYDAISQFGMEYDGDSEDNTNLEKGETLDSISEWQTLPTSDTDESQGDISDSNTAPESEAPSVLWELPFEDIPLEKQQIDHILSILRLADNGKICLTKEKLYNILDEFSEAHTDDESSDSEQNDSSDDEIEEEEKESESEEDTDEVILSPEAIDYLIKDLKAARSCLLQLAPSLLRYIVANLDCTNQ